MLASLDETPSAKETTIAAKLGLDLRLSRIRYGGFWRSNLRDGERGWHTCGVTTGGGSAYCWGENVYGQLGDGTTGSRMDPARVVWP